MPQISRVALAAAVLLALSLAPALAQEDGSAEWLIGRWVVAHDPEGRPGDTLEFAADGDVVNVWPDGTRTEGIYVLTERGVKAVFSYGGRDLITTFHTDPTRSELRIVTSANGEETVYRKDD
jgi:hypothetical protein